MKTNRILLGLLVILLGSCAVQPDPPVNSPESLNRSLLKGWNTFDVTSISTQVLLPEGLALNLQINDSLSEESLRLTFTGNQVKNSEEVWTLAHRPDGSYTDYLVRWKDFGLRVQSMSEGEELRVLVTPADTCSNPGYLQLNASIYYGREGSIGRKGNYLAAYLAGTEIRIYPAVPDLAASESTVMRFDLHGPAAYSTRRESLDQIREAMKQSEQQWLDEKATWGEQAEVYAVVQNALNWLVIYDDQQNRLVTPVARPWSYGWGKGQPGGYVLFCWDNFFASFMHSLTSKELAFNEAIQMCREIDELGFVPNFSAPHSLKSRDRSQPPVGGMMVKEIYLRHPERWFLESVFERLLTWNRWWDEKRELDGYLCWGSDPFEPVLGDRREMTQAVHQAAAYESGLDNSPMFEDVPFDSLENKMLQGDVGLMGLYVGDCDALAFLAGELGREEEADELRERAGRYRRKLQTMWNEEFGLYLNYRIDTGEPSFRISPTNFYALIGRAATQEQAERMVREHLYNPEEFWGDYVLPSIARNDPSYTGKEYWRGSIWAPMNFLVYLGLREYELPEARKDLARKSKELLLLEWERHHFVRENYHAETGSEPGARSNPFYHWGALLGMIELMENAGY